MGRRENNKAKGSAVRWGQRHRTPPPARAAVYTRPRQAAEGTRERRQRRAAPAGRDRPPHCPRTRRPEPRRISAQAAPPLPAPLPAHPVRPRTGRHGGCRHSPTGRRPRPSTPRPRSPSPCDGRARRPLPAGSRRQRPRRTERRRGASATPRGHVPGGGARGA